MVNFFIHVIPSGLCSFMKHNMFYEIVHRILNVLWLVKKSEVKLYEVNGQIWNSHFLILLNL